MPGMMSGKGEVGYFIVLVAGGREPVYQCSEKGNALFLSGRRDFPGG